MKNDAPSFFGGLGLKIFGLLAALGVTIVLIVWQGLGALDRTSGLITELVERQVPVLGESNDVLAKLIVISEEFAAILDAPTDQALRDVAKMTSVHIDALRQPMQHQGNDTGLALLGEIETRLAEVTMARLDEFAQAKAVTADLKKIQAATTDIAREVAFQGELAYADLLQGGDQTMARVSQGFATFVAGDVAGFHAVLAARAEVGVMSGILLSMGVVNDRSQTAVLRSLTAKSINRLSSVTNELSAKADTRELAGVLTAAASRMLALFETPDATTASQAALQRDLRALDDDLLLRLQDLHFDLEMAASDLSDANKAAITGLMQKHVPPLRRLGKLDAAARSVLAFSVEVALVDRVEAMPAAQSALAARAKVLATEAKRLKWAGASIDTLLQLAEPSRGIAAAKQAQLSARNRAETASIKAGEAVNRMSTLLLGNAGLALDDLTNTARITMASSAAAAVLMADYAVAATVVLAIAPFLAWFFVIAPLRRATLATAQLASGNLGAADKLKPGNGELGQLARALTVFRDSLRQNIAMQEAEKRKEKEQAARKQAEQRAEMDRQAQEAARKAEAQQRESARRAEMEAERQKTRAAADAERQAMLDIQNRVVSALASGLNRLSHGDLTAEIDQPFAKGYDELRLDFNAALATLRSLIGDIRDTANGISDESASVSTAAEELSRRTESTAATLEQSSAALTELTKLVRSTAHQSGEARGIAATANTKSEQGREAVGRAKVAMEAIAASSTQISKIVEMIQGIAFQTNLLALNAGVEAARAGETGRGFAVVAQEVRALSQRTTEAAQEISGLIVKSADDVNRGVEIVADVDEVLGQINSAIGNLNQAIAEISAATADQSSGLSEIDSAVGQLDQNTQGNAAISEQVTATGQSLLVQVGQLNDKLEKFNVDRLHGRPLARSA